MTRYRVQEGSSLAIGGTVVDGSGTAVPGAQVSSATLTLYDVETLKPTSPVDAVINSRDAVDLLALSPNEIEISALGVFEIMLQAADNVIVTPRKQAERHRARVVFTFSGGTYTTEQEIVVINHRTI